MATDNDQVKSIPSDVLYALERLLKAQQAHEQRVTEALTRIEGKVDGMDRRLKALIMDALAEDSRIEREIHKLAVDVHKLEEEVAVFDGEVEPEEVEAVAIDAVAQALADQIEQGAVQSCPKCGSHVVYRHAGAHAYLGICNACGWHVMLPKEALTEVPTTEQVVEGEKSIHLKGDGSEAPPAENAPHDWVQAGDDE